MEESSDIITWTKSGLAFQVVDYGRFSEEILQKYFRHNKFSSFRRQLNLYGYRKVIKGPDAGAYMHPSFQRGRPDLLKDVKKGKSKTEKMYGGPSGQVWAIFSFSRIQASKVPHYDMHGINEIHGQHFRHHPPGEKAKEPPSPEPQKPAHVTPTLDPRDSPATPEPRGSPPSMMFPPRRLEPPKGESTPVGPRNSADAIAGLSNMSLGSLTASAAERLVDNMPEDDDQSEVTCSPSTLKPAYGGGEGEQARVSERKSGQCDAFMGEALGHDFQLNSGLGGERRHGDGADGTTNGDMQGGGSGEQGQGVGSTSSSRTAYWDMNRRQSLSSLVFPNRAPENTEEIIQPDPNLSDVVNVICQCMEVLSSTESSTQSQFSQCSFNNETNRRSSVLDLLSSISWESTMRPPQPPGHARLESFSGFLDVFMDQGAEHATSDGQLGVDSRDANIARDGSCGSNRSDGRQNHAQGNSGDMRRTDGTNSGQQQQSMGPSRPMHYQRPSFDANGDTSRDVNMIANFMEPAVVTATPSPNLSSAEPPPRSRPSFDPNRDPRHTPAPLLLAADRRDATSPALPPRCSPSPPIEAISQPSGRETYMSATPPPPTAKCRGPPPVARIFKAVPKSTSAPPTTAYGRDMGGSDEITSLRSGSWDAPRSDSGVEGPSSALKRGTGTERGVWGSSTTSSAGAAPANGSPAYVMSQMDMMHVAGSPRPAMVASSPVGSQPLGYYSPMNTQQSQHNHSPTPFQRPSISRKLSATWLREPVPERRPTILEEQEMKRLLAKSNHLATWQRVADDQDSMSLAQNIGEFLG